MLHFRNEFRNRPDAVGVFTTGRVADQDGFALDAVPVDVQFQRSNPSSMSPEISPDGRWLAYQSNESGQDEVYVRPFPAVDRGRVLISTAGGTRPAWTPKGDELLYIDAKGLLTAVPLQVAGSTIKPGLPVTVSRTVYFPGVSALGVTPLRGFDVAPDGQRFLMIKETAEADQAGGLASVVVRLNVTDYLSATRSQQESPR